MVFTHDFAVSERQENNLHKPRFKEGAFVAFYPSLVIPQQFDYIKESVFQIVSIIDRGTNIKYAAKVIEGNVQLPPNAQFVLPEKYLCGLTKTKISNAELESLISKKTTMGDNDEH